MTPSGAIRRTRLLNVSTKYMEPSGPNSESRGSLTSALVACPPSPEKPGAEQVPAMAWIVDVPATSAPAVGDAQTATAAVTATVIASVRPLIRLLPQCLRCVVGAEVVDGAARGAWWSPGPRPTVAPAPRSRPGRHAASARPSHAVRASSPA